MIFKLLHSFSTKKAYSLGDFTYNIKKYSYMSMRYTGIDSSQMLNTYSKQNTVLEASGLISRKTVRAELVQGDSKGINFRFGDSLINANYKNISSTQRNTVLSNSTGDCICLTEHFLAACALLGLTDFALLLSEPELPFGDGSAALWIDFLQSIPSLKKIDLTNRKKLSKVLKITDDFDASRFIEMRPAHTFSIEYRLDLEAPRPIKQSYSWKQGDDVYAFAQARTFSNEEENKLLGLDAWVLGLSREGFSKDLHYDNELAAHKALDLLGDLMLSGYNPLMIDMHIISNKGGHALNAKAAQLIAEVLN